MYIAKDKLSMVAELLSITTLSPIFAFTLFFAYAVIGFAVPQIVQF